LVEVPSLWQEVPSVTTVLGVLDKSGALTWWGMKVGAEGAMWLVNNQHVDPRYGTTEEIVALLTEHKMTVNHVKDAAADRGVNVHTALETWANTGVMPKIETFQEHEQGYVKGLCAFIEAVHGSVADLSTEVMVGSLEHLYAGRYDLRLTLTKPVELVTKCYPKKADKVETVPAGKFLADAKTSKRIYESHRLQLEAYEQASVECGYEPTDYRAVLHLTADGKYAFSVDDEWTFQDFATVRQTYAVMNERAKLKNERDVESALRDELSAKDAA